MKNSSLLSLVLRRAEFLAKEDERAVPNIDYLAYAAAEILSSELLTKPYPDDEVQAAKSVFQWDKLHFEENLKKMRQMIKGSVETASKRFALNKATFFAEKLARLSWGTWWILLCAIPRRCCKL